MDPDAQNGATTATDEPEIGPRRRRGRLKVVFRRIQRESAGDDRVLSVFCQRRGTVLDLRSCRGCEHCQGLCIDPSDRQTFLRCSFGGSAAATPEEGDRPGASPPAGASRDADTTLADVMTSPVHCATRDMGIEALTALFLEQGISAVPVVDGEGHAIGVVSKTDVLRRYYEASESKGVAPRATATEEEVAVDLGPGFRTDRLAEATVADVMTHVVFCLEQSAPLSRAAALMAYEGVHRVVITSADGVARGIVSSLDILRWIARKDGYVVPDLTRPQTDPPTRG